MKYVLNMSSTSLSFFTGLGTQKVSAASFAISAYAAKTKTFYYSWLG
jgi:hypothetical protein